MQNVTSTAIRWLERYAKELKANGSLLMLADVNPAVVDVLKKSGALDAIGEQNVFPASPRVLGGRERGLGSRPALAAATVRRGSRELSHIASSAQDASRS